MRTFPIMFLYQIPDVRELCWVGNIYPGILLRNISWLHRKPGSWHLEHVILSFRKKRKAVYWDNASVYMHSTQDEKSPGKLVDWRKTGKLSHTVLLLRLLFFWLRFVDFFGLPVIADGRAIIWAYALSLSVEPYYPLFWENLSFRGFSRWPEKGWNHQQDGCESKPW